MGFYKQKLLNHFTKILPVLERAGAQATLNLRSFQVQVIANGRAYTLYPQFMKREKGVRTYTPKFDAEAARFIGWCPYFNKRWDFATDKLAFKGYATAAGLRTPEYSSDPDADMKDLVVKKTASSFARDVFGPFRRSSERRLRSGEGEFYERFVAGRIVKVYYWESRAVCLELEKPASVTGDGRRSIRQLLEPRLRDGDEAPLERAAEYLRYAGTSLDAVPAFAMRQQVDFRYGSLFNVGADLENVDLGEKPMPELAPQLEAIGERLWNGIPADRRSGTLYSVDAVLDDEQRLWLLEVNCNPFIHPFLYPVMLEALFRNDGAAQAAFAPRVTGTADLPVNEAFQLALTHLNAGAGDQALALFARILNEHAHHAGALYYSGRALVQGGRVNEGRHRLEVLLRTASRENIYAGPAAELVAAIGGNSPPPAIARTGGAGLAIPS